MRHRCVEVLSGGPLTYATGFGNELRGGLAASLLRGTAAFLCY